MTFGDPNVGRPFGRPGTEAESANNVQDVIPPTERSQDTRRTDESHDLAAGNIHPKADDQAAPIAERVYAPASERVPKEPVPGHRDVIEHTDTHTPERIATAQTSEPTGTPSFTRVARPTVYGTSGSPTYGNGGSASGTSGSPTYGNGGSASETSGSPTYGNGGSASGTSGSPTYGSGGSASGTSGSPTYGSGGPTAYGTGEYSSTSAAPGPYASPTTNPGFRSDYGTDWQSNTGRGRGKMFFGIGAGWMTVIAAGVGVWLFMRWRAERNKPVNRIRRQARQAWQTADDWRRSNIPDEATRPAAGIGSAMIPLMILLWRQSQSQSRAEAMREEARGRAEKAATRMGREADKAATRADKAARRAAETLSEVDWQSRLLDLKERWNPSRLEMEKVQISKR